MGERIHQGFDQIGARARQRHGGRQAARASAAKLGPERMIVGAAASSCAAISFSSAPVSHSMPLDAMTSTAFFQRGAALRQKARKCCAGWA